MEILRQFLYSVLRDSGDVVKQLFNEAVNQQLLSKIEVLAQKIAAGKKPGDPEYETALGDVTTCVASIGLKLEEDAKQRLQQQTILFLVQLFSTFVGRR